MSFQKICTRSVRTGDLTVSQISNLNGLVTNGAQEVGPGNSESPNQGEVGNITPTSNVIILNYTLGDDDKHYFINNTPKGTVLNIINQSTTSVDADIRFTNVLGDDVDISLSYTGGDPNILTLISTGNGYGSSKGDSP